MKMLNNDDYYWVESDSPYRKRPSNFELLGYNLVPGKPYLTTEDRLRALSRTRYYANGTFNKGYYEGLIAHELDDDDRALLESEMRNWFISDRNEKFHDKQAEENAKLHAMRVKKQQEEDKKKREEKIQRAKNDALMSIGVVPVVADSDRVFLVSPLAYEENKEIIKETEKKTKELNDMNVSVKCDKRETPDFDFDNLARMTPEQMRKIRERERRKKELKPNELFKKFKNGVKGVFVKLFCEEVEGNYEK